MELGVLSQGVYMRQTELVYYLSHGGNEQNCQCEEMKQGDKNQQDAHGPSFWKKRNILFAKSGYWNIGYTSLN